MRQTAGNPLGFIKFFDFSAFRLDWLRKIAQSNRKNIWIQETAHDYRPGALFQRVHILGSTQRRPAYAPRYVDVLAQ
jgi:hypothetical protein